jgi:curved DNA-binding protein CbpA
MTLQQAYETLGLVQGAEWEEIRRKHRSLVKLWHPDKFQTDTEQKIAHDKIIQINASYAYLRKIKYRSGINISTQNSSWEKSTKKEEPSIEFTFYTKTEKKTEKTSKTEHRSEFKQKKIDTLFSNLAKKRIHRRIKQNRVKTENFYKKKIIEEQHYWKKLRQNYDERTRLGLYRSFINAVIFGRFIYFQKTDSTSLSGRVTLQDKYEIDIRHNLIQDKIFYSVNKGFNLFLKYLFGGIYLILFVYFISIHFSDGRIRHVEDFLRSQFFVLSQFMVLLFPDNLFQRFVLWKYRFLEKKAIADTFKENKLPGKLQFYKQLLLLGKFSTLIIFLIFFFWIRQE